MPYFVNFFCFLFLFISSSSLKASDGFFNFLVSSGATRSHSRASRIFFIFIFSLFINLLAFSILLPGFPMGYFHYSLLPRSIQGYRFPSVQRISTQIQSFCGTEYIYIHIFISQWVIFTLPRVEGACKGIGSHRCKVQTGFSAQIQSTCNVRIYTRCSTPFITYFRLNLT